MDELEVHHARMEEAGLGGGEVAEVVCCHARQGKFWTQSPDGNGWEHDVVLGHSETFGEVSGPTEDGCCAMAETH